MGRTGQRPWSMAISIKDPGTDQLIRALASRTGEPITDAVRIAVEERLRRLPVRDRVATRRRLDDIAARGRSRVVRDNRSPEEIIGYDEHGLP